ncbi:hypothetical protein K0B96_02610 [Horticoccus luteus]|uniref:Uncharacterized protein n=1 Tax=Horticoccus luteus TaxID=2862869 RepID=A0A8F9TWW2_9BACT|nr:hypothetical protein [Horticoccus luteus]QYM79527.1 hypothetical protein K0B96_02610 [Horticoccus luteus]
MKSIKTPNFWILCVVCLGIFASALSGMSQRKAEGSVSLSELWQRRVELDGQVVRVRGFYVLESPISALYESRRAFDHDKHPLSLWIGANRPGSSAEKGKRGHLVDAVIEGRFVNQTAGTFEQFFAQLEDVTSFTLLESLDLQK